jgi:hypothetical protein
MTPGAPRHARGLARYLPLLSFAFLWFLSDAAEPAVVVPLEELPATFTGEIGESARHVRVDVHGSGPQAKIDLTSLDKALERTDRLGVEGAGSLEGRAVAYVDRADERECDALAFLVSRPTRAGP